MRNKKENAIKQRHSFCNSEKIIDGMLKVIAKLIDFV